MLERVMRQLDEWHGALPMDTFFDAWDASEMQREPLEIESRVIDDHLVLAAPPDSSVMAEGNRIRWEDGHEVVIRLAESQVLACTLHWRGRLQEY